MDNQHETDEEKTWRYLRRSSLEEAHRELTKFEIKYRAMHDRYLQEEIDHAFDEVKALEALALKSVVGLKQYEDAYQSAWNHRAHLTNRKIKPEQYLAELDARLMYTVGWTYAEVMDALFEKDCWDGVKSKY